MTKFSRCAKCRDYYLIDRLERIECPSCDYRSSRCSDCGGKSGALRSIIAHFHWWRGRGDGVGGHDRRALLEALKGEKKRRVA